LTHTRNRGCTEGRHGGRLEGVQPLGVHHDSVNVDDLEKAVDFYVGILGLSVRDDRPNLPVPGTWLDAGAQQLHLVQGEAPTGLGQHFALLVEDLDAVAGELRDKGFTVGGPMPVGEARQAFVTDPSGNLVELHQPAGT